MWNFLTPDSIIRRQKSIRMLDPDDLPITSIFFARGINPQIRDIERTTENLKTVLTAALHGVDGAKFKQDDYGKLVNRAELLKRTSKKPKATMRQLLVVLEENPGAKTNCPAFRLLRLLNCLLQALEGHCAANKVCLDTCDWDRTG
ncbi:hypothetical protein GJ744_007306 [Endocarpon pusillum]|uniref:Uncharacterized protein n=1 Tax=Endocarpon pusillum TaxID=364733 RepID=A0A8H7AN74_9EURO|nr:hypothetical protein GJ744_007306 [Endocarpon pusillum]